jgi:FkbM family methyltransferase
VLSLAIVPRLAEVVTGGDETEDFSLEHFYLKAEMNVRMGLEIRVRRAIWRVLRPVRRTVRVDTHQGRLTVFTRDTSIGRNLFVQREFQLDTTNRALSFLREAGRIPVKGEGVVLDIGANIGVISIGMLVNGEIDGAIGIEPEPDNFALLTQNVTNNRLEGHYTALQVAASDREASLPFSLNPGNPGDHRVVLGSRDADRPVTAVPGRPLDAIVSDLPRSISDAISLVWVDVQGHEGYVFAGGAAVFARDIPVVCELWPWGILRSGMQLETYICHAQQLWGAFWVWRDDSGWVRYPTTDLSAFVEELGTAPPWGAWDDVIFTHD